MFTGHRTGISLAIQHLDQASLNLKPLAFIQWTGHVEPEMTSILAGLNHDGPVLYRDLIGDDWRKIIEEDQGPGAVAVGSEIDVGPRSILGAKPGKALLDLAWVKVLGPSRARIEKGALTAP